MDKQTGEEIADVFRSLRRGLGRERVNDSNADALIRMAKSHGDLQLEYLLREWVSPCDDIVDRELPEITRVKGIPPPSHGER